mgnify:CR=1 FL=1
MSVKLDIFIDRNKNEIIIVKIPEKMEKLKKKLIIVP